MLFEFAARWINSAWFDNALFAGGGPHNSRSGVHFRFPDGCYIMIDAAVRLLSLVNQLHACGHFIRLEFVEGNQGTMGYLNRMGFFDFLPQGVEVLPHRPRDSDADRYRGSNVNLVEIERICREERDRPLPTRLSKAIGETCRHRPDVNELEGAAWTILAELIDNIYIHSETEMDGYAALQSYSGGNSLMVAVSDSGLGIMTTLRPTLQENYPSLRRLSDLDLLVEIFRQGISRHGSDRGCGLKGAAAKAMKFHADLDVRLPDLRVWLRPGDGYYRPHKVYCSESLPLLWGSHLCISIQLDSAS